MFGCCGNSCGVCLSVRHELARQASEYTNRHTKAFFSAAYLVVFCFIRVQLLIHSLNCIQVFSFPWRGLANTYSGTWESTTKGIT